MFYPVLSVQILTSTSLGRKGTRNYWFAFLQPFCRFLQPFCCSLHTEATQFCITEELATDTCLGAVRKVHLNFTSVMQYEWETCWDRRFFFWLLFLEAEGSGLQDYPVLFLDSLVPNLKHIKTQKRENIDRIIRICNFSVPQENKQTKCTI